MCCAKIVEGFAMFTCFGIPLLPQHISLDTLNFHQDRLDNSLAQAREGCPPSFPCFCCRHPSNWNQAFKAFQWVLPTSSSDPTNKPSWNPWGKDPLAAAASTWSSSALSRPPLTGKGAFACEAMALPLLTDKHAFLFLSQAFSTTQMHRRCQTRMRLCFAKPEVRMSHPWYDGMKTLSLSLFNLKHSPLTLLTKNKKPSTLTHVTQNPQP